MKKEIKQLALFHEYSIEWNIDPFKTLNILKSLKDFFQKKNEKQGVDLLKQYNEVLYHKMVAICQRNSFKNDQTNIEFYKDSILIIFDFKEKIRIGTGVKQTNKEYRNQQLRSCFGVTIFYKDDDSNKIKQLNYAVISDINSQTAEMVVYYLRFIRMQDRYKKIEKKNIKVWMDVGK